MGFKGKFEVHDQPQTLMSWNRIQQNVKAEIIIRKQYLSNISNDFGFTLQKDGKYKITVDTGYVEKNAGWVERLSTYYGIEKMKMEAESRGQKVYEDTDEKNRPRLRIKMNGGSAYTNA